jgi:hypothetical protein
VVHAKAAGTEAPGKTAVGEASTPDNTPDKKNRTARDADERGSRKVIAYYFHGTKRCWTCKRIEALTADTIKSNFSAELEEGVLELSPVNVDMKENKHFISDFKLYTKSVVIVEITGDRQTRWKNLERVWQLVHDEQAFIDYIYAEVKAYLSGD